MPDPVNDFQPFANQPGANVMTQAEYLEMAQRFTGFNAGLAESARLNKVWRQSAAMANVIGQFMADILGQDIQDNGDAAALLDQFKDAITAAASAGGAGLTVPVNTAQTIDNSAAGKRFVTTAAVTFTCTDASTLTTSFRCQVIASLAPAVIAPAVGDSINGVSGATVTIPKGHCAWIVAAGENDIYVNDIVGIDDTVNSAGTVDLSALKNKIGRLVGTTDIAEFGSTAPKGERYLLIVDGTFTLKYSSGTHGIIIPGQADYEVVPGDSFEVVHLGSGSWKVVNLLPISGAPVAVPYGIGSGAGRLVQSGGDIQFIPYNGNQISVAGRWRTIPPMSLAVSPTGLTASTTYYVYVHDDGTGSLVLECSETAWMLDNAANVPTKGGDLTWTLVGMVRTDSSGQFQDTPTQRLVLSYFNRKPKMLDARLSANVSPSGSTPQIHSSVHLDYLVWSGDPVWLSLAAMTVSNTTVNYSSISLDGTIDATGAQTVSSLSVGNIAMQKAYSALSEGYHYSAIGANAGGFSVRADYSSGISGIIWG
ncbi:MAG: hypothetical protein E6Q98_16110 [Rhodospirillaceae bacterium]|nr:MAG: hypothetical protein E6Q98_16110 [Rhodospirillaceae bacterium]